MCCAEKLNRQIVLRNARLIPSLTEGWTSGCADILIDGANISGIYPQGRSFPGSHEIDVGGKTVLPGFIDLHTHLYFYNTDDNYLAQCSQQETLLNSIAYAKELLCQGFTTVRDCGAPFYTAMAVRDSISRGLFAGPRIFACGYGLSPYAPGNDGSTILDEVNSPEEILKSGRMQAAHGADFLKYFATGSVGRDSGIPNALLTTPEELQALQNTAVSLGRYASAHCHSKAGILLCADVGIRTIEHASDIDDECTDRILSNGNRSAIVPTLGPIGLMRSGLLGPHVSEKVKETSQGQSKMVAASRAGILTGWGTDVSLDYYMTHPGSEFLLREERGWSNIEILQQATINSAKILGMESTLGTIKSGKLADLVVVNGNPDEDLSVMREYPWLVLKNGVPYTGGI